VGSDFVIFEPASRHSFKEGVGRQIANPTAMILCAAKVLNHLHLPGTFIFIAFILI
jgi:isocitrate dehydrogenase (NAD+)